MHRHPDNPNLSLVYGPLWRGLPLPTTSGPYIHEYLDRLREVLADVGSRYARQCIVRFDLHFPQGLYKPDPSSISRFFHRLPREIAHDQKKRPRCYSCEISYCWAAEQDRSVNQHYHVALFLNKDAYYGLGRYPSTGFADEIVLENARGLAHCILRAWAHALWLHPRDVLGCVFFAFNGVYHLDRNSQIWSHQFLAAFERIRYLAKARTKKYGTDYRSFGSSRTRQRSEEELQQLLPPQLPEEWEGMCF